MVTLRRVRKCVQALSVGLLVYVLMVYWEDLDHHVLSHMVSFSYRYLIDSYDFLNSSLAFSAERARPPRYLYVLNHPQKCRAAGDDVLLLVFVKSTPSNFARRKAIRETWGDERFIQSALGATVRLLFAVGLHAQTAQRSKVQTALMREDRLHGDLIQQNFVDTFHNLTAKLILQIHWSHAHCRRARFLMSADDDVFVHMPNLVKYLKELNQSGAEGVWVGHVYRGSPPNHRRNSKYHVPAALYPWPCYPDYTAGAAYVLSADVAAKIYRATLLLKPSLYIDDVFMGICARAVNVAPREHAYFAGEAKAPYHRCIYDHMITSHGHAADMRALWRAATNSSQARGIVGKVYCAAVRVALLCLPFFHNAYSCLAAFA